MYQLTAINRVKHRISPKNQDFLLKYSLYCLVYINSSLMSHLKPCTIFELNLIYETAKERQGETNVKIREIGKLLSASNKHNNCC